LPFVGQESDRYIKGEREVFFEEADGFIATKIYDGDQMESGNIAEGPCIIEQYTTTIVVPPGGVVEVNEYGDFLITLEN